MTNEPFECIQLIVTTYPELSARIRLEKKYFTIKRL